MVQFAQFFPFSPRLTKYYFKQTNQTLKRKERAPDLLPDTKMNIFHFSQHVTWSMFQNKLGTSLSDKGHSTQTLLGHIRGRRTSNNEDIQTLRGVLSLGKQRQLNVYRGYHYPHLPQTHTAPPRLTNKQTIKNVQGLFIKWIDLFLLLPPGGGFQCFFLGDFMTH